MSPPKNHLLLIHALSPLHAGTGQGIGVIDLPIAREAATGLPFLPGSSLKGSLRDRCTHEAVQKVLFGPPPTQAGEHAGALVFSDQRLLLLPVRSLYGVFAWVTCPLILRRFERDVALLGGEGLPVVPSPGKSSEGKVGAAVAKESVVQDGDRIVLEDLDLHGTKGGEVGIFADWLGTRLFPGEEGRPWRGMLKQRLCVVPDDVMSFLCQTATEITARIRLDDDTRTVVEGGLWYEEALPAETVLAGLVAEMPNAKALELLRALPPMDERPGHGAAAPGKHGQTAKRAATLANQLQPLCDAPLQLGGKANVGRGVCRLRLTEGG